MKQYEKHFWENIYEKSKNKVLSMWHWSNFENDFWKRVDKSPGHGPNGDCWLWKGRHHKKTCRPILSMGSWYHGNERVFSAYRVAYEISVGEIPDGLMICHKCDNPRCVNYEHLYAGTHENNTLDAVSRGRVPYGNRKPGAKLSPEKIENMRYLKLLGFSQVKLAQMFEVSRSTVCTALSGKTWSRYKEN